MLSQMRRAALTTVTVLTLAACGPGGVSGPDAGGDVDTIGPAMSGLVFRFVAPDLGETVDDLTVSEIAMSVRDIRALGDAAPGDDRTTLDRGVIVLPGSVPEFRFDEAPPGRYSQLELEIDRSSDGEASWTMTGTVHFSGEDWPFEIDDDGSHPISIPLQNVNLVAGEVAIITIAIDVTAIGSAVDWESLPQGDTLAVDDDTPQELAAATASLVTSFSVASVDIQ